MEILEIRSGHDLTAHSPTERRVGAHSYQVNCRQFASIHKTWVREGARPTEILWVMTLGFERIWMTVEESQQVAAAIKATHSPILLD
ncbi:MAG TPA: hypothetical protein VFD70_27610 [Anaerolineae bacterium]|nr:hypothetical protein [Anaerolineae bacterium]